MRRRLWITALLLMAGAAAGASPTSVVACSCAETPSLRVVVDEWGNAVFTGLAVTRTGDVVSFAIERWYAGPGAAPVVQIRSGDGAMCGVDIKPGDYLALTASRAGDGTLVPSICSPYARMGTAEAAKLIAEAERTFGAGQAFGGESGGDPPPGGLSDWLPVIAIGAAILVIGGLGLTAFVLVRRREA